MSEEDVQNLVSISKGGGPTISMDPPHHWAIESSKTFPAFVLGLNKSVLSARHVPGLVVLSAKDSVRALQAFLHLERS